MRLSAFTCIREPNKSYLNYHESTVKISIKSDYKKKIICDDLQAANDNFTVVVGSIFACTGR